MAAITAPGSRRSLIGTLTGTLAARSRARGRPSRLAAALQQHLMTFAGLAAADFAFFHVSDFAGWLAVGVSALLADFKING